MSGLSAVTVFGKGFVHARIRKVELEVHVGSSEPQPLPMARDMRLREEYVCKTDTAPKTFLIYREHTIMFLKSINMVDDISFGYCDGFR